MSCKPLSAYLIQPPSPSRDSKCGGVSPMREGESFGLTDYERSLFDSITQEHIGIIGTAVEYYSQSVAAGVPNIGVVDPLYSEPVARRFLGPFALKGYFSYPEHDPTLGMEGWSSQINATAFIPRVEFEKVGIVPAESDILRVFNNPYWNQASVDGFNIPLKGMYFSVVGNKEDGMLFDTVSFMGFTLTLRRITQQAPERKIINNL